MTLQTTLMATSAACFKRRPHWSMAWLTPRIDLTRVIVAASLMLIVAAWVAIFVHVSQEREKVIVAATKHAQNMARAAARHIEHIFRSIDQFTWTVKQLYESGR